MLLIPTYMAQEYNFDIDDNFFSVSYAKKTNITPITDWTAFAIINMLKDSNNLNKYKLIEQYVLNNSFYKTIDKNKFFDTFCIAQKYFVILKCITYYGKINAYEITLSCLIIEIKHVSKNDCIFKDMYTQLV